MNAVKTIKALRHKLYIAYFRTMPIQKNKIVFFSNLAQSYSCNPKYLSEYLLQEHPEKYEIVWIISSEISAPEDIPDNVRIVRYFSIEYLKEISTAGFIICNTRIPPEFMFKKRREQCYIQTWHGSLALKVIEKDAEDYLDEPYKENAKFDSSQIDMIPASSHFSAEQYRNGFWYDGEIMECGTPRCDIFFDKSSYARLIKKHNIPQEHKVLLYAPTFRNNKKPNIFGINFKKIKKCLELVTGKKWHIVFKLHPNLGKIKYEADDDNIVNVDSKADLQELLVVSDILITDYSSCMFDMGIMNKMCLLYAPDLEDYMENERRLYFDIKKLPFPLCRNNEDLVNTLECFDKEAYISASRDFNNMIGNKEMGHACEEIEKYMDRTMKGYR